MKRTRKELIAGAAAVVVLLTGILIFLNQPSIGTVLKRLKSNDIIPVF